MSRLLNIAWLVWTMIQSNRAPYNDLAMESLSLEAWTQNTETIRGDRKSQPEYQINLNNVSCGTKNVFKEAS